MLEKAVDEYLGWMTSQGYAPSTIRRQHQVLIHFISYIKRNKVPFDDIFTFKTLQAFAKDSGLSLVSSTLKGMSRYLYRANTIAQPIKRKDEPLPQIYEQYLVYYKKSRNVHHLQILRTRRTLSAFNDYLSQRNVRLSGLDIEKLDSFLADYGKGFTPETRQNHRSILRGFLKYLYFERKILKRDLGALLIAAPIFGAAKPPKFLRAEEIKKLLGAVDLSTPKGLRATAMLHLAYYLGLRPKEVSLITLDDISFTMAEITLASRKSLNPIKLPLPECAIKSMAAYIVGARPQSKHRALFLTFRPPISKISAQMVGKDIGECMKKLKIPATAYWLRHTYAQNLLEKGASIFEIKEMLGHDDIQSSRRYIQINVKLMRKLLFNEEI